MEIVVLNSDIARLVLDYLKSQKLKKATRTFCKTSPYLKQEFSAYKQGLQTHSFFPELEEIICEYVKISRKVEHLMPKLTDALRSKLQQCKLSEKVNELLERATHAILVSNVSSSKIDFKSSAPTIAASQIYNDLNENDGNRAKRKRSFENSNNSNDEKGAEININKQNKLTPNRFGHCSKKRRILRPYCFLSAKALQRYKRGYHSKESVITTTDEDIEEENQESLSSVEDATNSVSELEESNDYEDPNEEKIFNSEKPSKESTRCFESNKKTELMAPIIPGISQAILDNVEFQERLVENINQALNQSVGLKSASTASQKDNESENPYTPLKKITAAAEEITSSQLLDQMIKNILEATEKEPSFDAIINEVVESSNKQPQVQVQSAAVQCNIKDTNLPPVAENPSMHIPTDPPPLVPTQTNAPLQQYPAPIIGTVTTTKNILNTPTTNIQQPRTPIMLRSLPGATATTSSAISSTTLNGQDQPNPMLGNNTIGSLIDPNFSISKLIVLNSNDSIPKQPPETAIDNLINQLPSSGIVDANDEQVYFDKTTGQLTFPVFVTNDGIITNFPFIINNELISHPIQPSNMTNLEGCRSEIPYSEPIIVSANQLPPNTIILSNAQMESISEKPVATIEKINTREQHSKILPASLDNRLIHEKATPSPSSIINTKAFKSLSTPRKRTSHIRTLTFSPRGPQSMNNMGTPLSTRTDAICRYQRSFPKAITEETSEATKENESKSEEKEKTSEKPVIKTVEILPALTSVISETITGNTNASTTETSSIPPLFVSEESSNQTIINKHALVTKETAKECLKPKDLKNVAAQDVDKTPKRKQFRKAAVRSCKRQLAKAANENEVDLLEEKPEKENENTTIADCPDQTDAKSTKDPMMEEWLRLRNSNIDLDVRLREINAKSTQSSHMKKANTKKRVRRRKPAAVKKKEKELAKKAGELEKSKELEIEAPNQNSNTGNQDILESNKQTGNEKSGIENGTNSCVDLNDKTTISNTTKPNKMAEEKGNRSEEIVKHAAENNTSAEAPNNSFQDSASSQTLQTHDNDAVEREKRTTNIAFLLETPFKDPNLASCNPPTPGIFAPSLETPAGKLKDRQHEMQASASFLFGSITKSELDTPPTTALTPGFRFTPFGLKEIATPKSLAGTDYSSGGGSYYKPDESEDLDRNIDKMLKNTTQKKFVSKEANDTDDVEQPEGGEIVVKEHRKEIVEEIEFEKIEVEIPMEKLKVEPIVLKRVKSFSSEDTECIETAKIDPHYTLVSGLPEISAAEEESSSSSSSSSSSGSSSSKSSSSSSSASSSSSSSSSSSNASALKKTVLETTPSAKQANINDLESLSEISSTEDEEWQKLAVTDNDENSQLVGNDGEVRYPVRSWLTPIKEKITIETKTFEHNEVTRSTTSTKSTTIKVSVPLKSAEKRSIEVKELELKKERIKEKLKNDANTIAKKEKPTISATPNISAALAATRIIHAMRDKGKKSGSSYQMPQTMDSNTSVDVSPVVQEKRSLDVLTALNLSAKKHLPIAPEKSQNLSRRLSEDNGTPAVNSPNNLKGKNKIKISPSSANKTPQRKCLPIEARPVTRTIRKSGKKIVRTPLAFKVIHSPGKINSHSTTTTLAELAKAKTLNKSKEAESSCVPQTVRVSPRLMKTSKLLINKPPESPAPKNKVTTRNAKAKAAVAAKMKVTRSQNHDKVSAEAPSDNEMKGLLHSSKEDSWEKKNNEQFEEDGVQKSVVATKPKIHLKARNAMISMKQKNMAKRELVAAHKVEAKKTNDAKTLCKELPSENLDVATSKKASLSTQTVKADLLPLATTLNKCNEDDDGTEDDEDPLLDCEMTTIDETDTKRFIKYTFDGPDKPPDESASSKLDDFSNFQMLVAIDENEKHIWRITEGICLYSCAPSMLKPVTAVAKKRKMRVSTVTTITSENASSIGSAVTSATINTKIAALKAFNTNIPTATSTPVAIQTSSSRTIAEKSKTSCSVPEGGGGGSKSKVGTRQTTEANKKSLPETSNETSKLQIEDIESILSHLHGT